MDDLLEKVKEARKKMSQFTEEPEKYHMQEVSFLNHLTLLKIRELSDKFYELKN